MTADFQSEFFAVLKVAYRLSGGKSSGNQAALEILKITRTSSKVFRYSVLGHMYWEKTSKRVSLPRQTIYSKSSKYQEILQRCNEPQVCLFYYLFIAFIVLKYNGHWGICLENQIKKFFSIHFSIPYSIYLPLKLHSKSQLLTVENLFESLSSFSDKWSNTVRYKILI